MKKAMCMFLFVALAVASGAAKQPPLMSGNPIFEGWYADPEGIIYDDTYWIYPTWSDDYEKQTFFDCFSSKDLVTWTKHPSILDTSAVKWAKKAMWAPSVIRKGGKYYLFFGANDVHEGETGGIGVAVSDRPEGPYRDLIGKPLINDIVNGAQPIDQFVYKDGDTYYMYYGGWGHCNVVKLNDDFTALVPFDDGQLYKEVTPDNYTEGPFMFKRNNKYYFMWSEGGWGGPDYSVAYAIADSPFGPFRRIGKILQQDSAVATGAGHHSVIQPPGTDSYYIVYHRHPLNDKMSNHRVTCIDRMTFDDKGLINPVKMTFDGVEKQLIPSAGLSDAAFEGRVSAEDFMIFPWGGMPLQYTDGGAWGDMPDAGGMMKDLFDCGYNATGFIPVNYVEYAAPYRLATILWDDRIASYPDVSPEEAGKTVQSVLDQIKSPEIRNSVYSIYIKDEPNASLFPRLGLWAEAIRKHGVLPYINLFPDNASDKQLGSNGYEDHIDAFMKACKAQYISYDNYSLYEENEFREDRFYGNLETVRKKSLQYGIPFWNVILGNTHFHYADPTQATLNVQVYSTLAYGGKGIGYFTHYAPELGNYRLASIDQFGHRTKTWELVRNINLQIHALAPIYCQLKSVNVFHTGHVPRNAHGQESAVYLESIGEGQFLVGEFTDPAGKPYLLVVNKDVKRSVQLKVSFRKKGHIVLVSPYGRGKVKFEGEQDWLAPGAGALLTVE